MKQIRGDLWKLATTGTVCITTNGFVKRDGSAVMGRGCARQARDRYPGIDRVLGESLRHDGNHTHVLMQDGSLTIVSFPVKHYWHQPADPQLIARSAHELVELLDDHDLPQPCLLPRPGCGNGQLSWTDVEPLLADILDDRVSIVTY
jgi:hypothetical protein